MYERDRVRCGKAVVRNFSLHQNHLKGILKPRSLGPTPRVSDSGSQRQGDLRIYISNKFPGDANAAGLQTIL